MLAMRSAPGFDLREIPFSVRGSYVNLSPVTGIHTVTSTVHLVSHRIGMRAVLALEPVVAGEVVEAHWKADPSCFTWQASQGRRVEATFDGPGTVRLRGTGLGLRVSDAATGLTPFTGTYLFVDPLDDSAVFTSYETGRRYRVTLLRGAWEVSGDQALGQAERAVELGRDARDWEAAVQEMDTASSPYRSSRSFEEVVEGNRATFDDYLARLVPDAEAAEPDAEAATPTSALAAYVMWSATVAADGPFTRETVLMSKHWMDRLWSWDHCFNALALAPGLADEALDQFLAPFDHQDASGALPDSVGHDGLLRNYVKPPIHGWAFARLRRTLGRELDPQELRHAYDVLSRLSRFWLDYRRRPGHALPYYQHGNDSGWDNSTTFDLDRVIEAPDLAAFLVLQLEVVADLATELGQPADEWTTARDAVLEALLAELWVGDTFAAVGASSGRTSSTTSLLNLLPLVLGERLPAEMRSALAARVEEHLTPHGLATEPVSSPHYEDDGYWRGPIWAPSTALVEDGLRQSGYTELADTVRARFIGLCEASGFAENFDARTGRGLRDRAYTWTAAVYLTFVRESADSSMKA